MFMMQNNDSRLIKAAKRTIRAEATLVVIIIIITSWSVYALYKLSVGGSDSILGWTFSKGDRSSSSQDVDIGKGPKKNSTTVAVEAATNFTQNDHLKMIGHQPSETTNQQLTYLQPDEAISKYRSQILQDILTSQRELYSNHLGSFANPMQFIASNQLRSAPQIYRQQDQQQQQMIPNLSTDLRGGYRLPSRLNNLLEQQHRQQMTQDTSSLPLSQFNRSANLRLALNLPSLMQLSRAAAATSNKNPIPQSDSDMELDDNNQRVEDNLSNERQAAESSRDPSESIAGPSDTAESQPTAAAPGGNVADDNQVESGGESGSGDNLAEEGDNQESAGDNQDDSTQTNSEPTNGDQDNSDQSSTSDEEPDRADDHSSLNETGHAVDEEVDRMTQPSSGVVSQQERPFDYKNTVQFDDSLGTGGALSSSKQMAIKPVAPGDLIARFVAPTFGVRHRGGGLTNKSNNSSRLNSDSDLQVDHNSLVISNGAVDAPRKQSGKARRLKGDDDDEDIYRSRKRKMNATKEQPDEFPVVTNGTLKLIPKLSEQKLKGGKFNKQVLSRRKRWSSSPRRLDIIRAPYEIDDFLNTLDFDNLIGMSTTSNIISRRKPRNITSNDLSSAILALNEETNSTAPLENDAEAIYSDATIVNHKNSPQKEVKANSISADSKQSNRRSDEGDDESDEEAPEDDRREAESEQLATGQVANVDLTSATLPKYHYLTSNDTELQELLAEKRLLDALRQSQLPSPYVAPNQNNYTNSSPPSNTADHHAAGSLFSVDHGLLLYPSADEEHSHKSMSKKKKKHEKMKDKKKMTVAIKKGGHKKKKHKKEEKKFLKEKKFKGAKKGKKVSKGKGGQGGKKGKKLYKDKGFKKKGFKNVYHKEEFGQKKSYFDEFRDKDFKKKWKKFDDKYNYAQMKKWQAKDVKGAKKMKDQGEKYKKYDKSKWKKKYQKHSKEHKESSKKNKKYHDFR